MHRLMCIFVINRFQTTFSHETTVVSEIYCQNLKDKTSILSLGQIIKMCYCRIHAHVHAWTAPWLITFFSTNGELSYKSNKMLEHIVRLELMSQSMSQSNSLVTIHFVKHSLLSAQSDHFSLPTQRYLKRFKNPWFVDSGSKHFDCTRWVFRLTECVFFWCSFKINMLLNHFHLGWNQVGTARSRW